MRRELRGLMAVAAVLSGCVTTTPPTAVHQPMTARPEPRNFVAPLNGSIYNVASSRPLFEDRRARFVGDLITINIAEKTQASKNSENKTSRNQTIDASIDNIAGLPLKALMGSTLAAHDKNEFNGKGQNTSANDFTGTITVTVIEVIANGNLLVSGEKQIGLKEARNSCASPASSTPTPSPPPTPCSRPRSPTRASNTRPTASSTRLR